MTERKAQGLTFTLTDLSKLDKQAQQRRLAEILAQVRARVAEGKQP